MEKKLKEMTVSTSIEVSVGDQFQPIKIRGFMSKTFEVDPGFGNDRNQEAQTANKELGDQYQVVWHQVKKQAGIQE